MKNLLLFPIAGLMVVTSNTFAQNSKVDSAPQGQKLTAHIDMHEKMAAAHKNAADCLKQGKPPEECRAKFMKECQEAGSPMGCGMGGAKRRGMSRGTAP